MAAPGKKKPVVLNKEDLRRLMKEKRNVTQSTAKKIDSPLARYNNLGQLSCVICNLPVKSDKLWNAHIMGRTHKENVAAFKVKSTPTVQPDPFVKPALPSHADKRKRDRKSQEEDQGVSKVPRGTEANQQTDSLPADFFDSKPSGNKNASSLSLGDYSSSDEEEEEEQDAPVSSSTVPSTTIPGLPGDFFDSGIKASGSTETEEAPKPVSMAEKLPEGFFDDPKMDAKVRQVVFKDKMEEEWELFQKAMKEENTVSEAILEEDEEVTTTERNIDEIDEQLHRWSKVDSLQKKKEELMASKQDEDNKSQNSDSDVDDQDFEEFLDWRSKEAWT